VVSTTRLGDLLRNAATACAQHYRLHVILT